MKIGNARNIVTFPDDEGNPFVGLIRKFESAYETGDYERELQDLSTAIAYSVLNKCADPQRKTAPGREKVSNSGMNPVMLSLKRGITRDLSLLDNTRRNADKATHTTYNKDGDAVTETADHDALEALSALIRETLSDGVDLVQEASLAILEQAAEHAGDPEWMENPYTVSRLARKVYIKAADSAAYREEETTPIQEIFRSVRRSIMASRAVQADPRNGYFYVSDVLEDGETIFYRSGKYADIGGTAVSDTSGLATADKETLFDYWEIMERLNLTARQRQILELRMQGRGYKAIATYLGIREESVKTIMKRLRKQFKDMFQDYFNNDGDDKGHN